MRDAEGWHVGRAAADRAQPRRDGDRGRVGRSPHAELAAAAAGRAASAAMPHRVSPARTISTVLRDAVGAGLLALGLGDPADVLLAVGVGHGGEGLAPRRGPRPAQPPGRRAPRRCVAPVSAAMSKVTSSPSSTPACARAALLKPTRSRHPCARGGAAIVVPPIVTTTGRSWRRRPWRRPARR